MRSARYLLIAPAIASCLLPAYAAEGGLPVHPALSDRFYIGLGGFMPTSSTSAQLNSSGGGVGAVVNFEDLLGMQSQKGVPVGMARIRFAQRWRVEAEYFELNRTGVKSIERDISWGDVVYPVGTNVNSKFDFSDARVSVGYSFFKTVDKEVGAAFGLHVARYNASLTAPAVGTQGGATTAPLPVLSLYGAFALTDHWAVTARLDYLSLSYEQYKGGINSAGIDVLYQPFKHIGLGLGFRSLFLNLETQADNWKGKIDQSFQGPIAYVTASF
jgi:hypothetical protein